MSGLVSGLVVRLVLGLTVGLAVGLVIGIVEAWSRPRPDTRASTPLESYRSDRRLTLVVGLAVAVGLGEGLVGGLTGGVLFGLVAGLGSGLTGELESGFAPGPAVTIRGLEMVFWMRGKPVRFLPLLETALDRKVLRQAGTVYQFRHSALQDQLVMSAGNLLVGRAEEAAPEWLRTPAGSEPH
jgi:hypothetical protein